MKNTPTYHFSTRLVFTLLTVGCAVILLFSPVVTAQKEAVNSIGIVATPTRVGDEEVILLKPGEKHQVTLRTRNISQERITVTSSAQDFIIADNGTTPIPITGDISNRWSLASWITTVPSHQNLAPGEFGVVNVLIEVPNDALPGGHYAMVTHQPAPAGQEDDTGSAAHVSQKVGTLLYVIVDGLINEEAFIRNFELPKLTEYGPVPFHFVVDNQSDVHIRPQISLTISNVLNQKVETIELEEKNIFPLQSRDFSGQWDRVWGVGLYKATLTMSFGYNGQVVTAHTYFWLFPVSIGLAVLTIVLVTMVVAVAIGRHLSHRKKNKKQRSEMLEQKLANMRGLDLEKYE